MPIDALHEKFVYHLEETYSVENEDGSRAPIR